MQHDNRSYAIICKDLNKGQRSVSLTKIDKQVIMQHGFGMDDGVIMQHGFGMDHDSLCSMASVWTMARYGPWLGVSMASV